MALRLGKKKDAPTDPPENQAANPTVETPDDDWSEAALMGQNDPPPSAIPAPSPAVAPASSGAPDPADAFGSDAFDSPPPKKKVSPVLLAGGLVLLLTGLGVGAYFAFSPPPEEEAIVLAPSPTPPIDLVAPLKPAPTRVALIPPKPAIKVQPKVGAPGSKVAAGRAGIVSPGTQVPAVRPQGGKAPAVVPKPNQPTPVPIMPDGMAGQPGKGSSVGTTVQVVRPAASSPAAKLPPTMQAQLKALWKQGADAKHQRNYNGARTAWRKMLKLRPGHPGVQQAIEKLPR